MIRSQSASIQVLQPMSTVVLDCGAESFKAGFAGHPHPSRIIPNCAFRPKRERRLYLADQIEEFVDFSSILYRRPFDRGYMVNTDLEGDILERVFGKSVLDVPTDSHLLLSEPVFNFTPIQNAIDELVFEKFNFSSFCRASTPFLASWLNPESFVDSSSFPIFNPCGRSDEADSERAPIAHSKVFDPSISLLLDSGFSFSHAIPIFNHYPLSYAIRRSNIGGKVMTNFLKETVSYRHYNMMDEFYLINQIKEKMCFVSMNFKADLQLCQLRKNPIRREFVLPNGSNIIHGYVKGDTEVAPSDSAPASDAESKKRKLGSSAEQSLPMCSERIMTPELLFHPNDVGLDQPGLPELIKQAIDASPKDIRPFLYSNIFVAGGNANLPNFCPRLERELRCLAPSDCDVRVFTDSKPVHTIWRAASKFAIDADFPKYCVTRAEYQEFGSSICARRFAAF